MSGEQVLLHILTATATVMKNSTAFKYSGRQKVTSRSGKVWEGRKIKLEDILSGKGDERIIYTVYITHTCNDDNDDLP